MDREDIIKMAKEHEPQPVAWYDSLSGWTDFGPYRPHRKPSSPSAEWIPLYASPPKKELTCVCGAVWEGDLMVHAPIQQKPLTEPELHEINPTWPEPGQHWEYEDVLAFVRAIERAHGIGVDIRAMGKQ